MLLALSVEVLERANRAKKESEDQRLSTSLFLAMQSLQLRTVLGKPLKLQKISYAEWVFVCFQHDFLLCDLPQPFQEVGMSLILCEAACIP